MPAGPPPGVLADPWDGVPRLAVPVLWAAAGLGLALWYVTRGLRHLLVLGERLHEAVGREVARACRSAVRALGPLGRQLQRGVRPALALLWRARAQAGRVLLRHVLVPLGRTVAAAWGASRPARRLVAVAVRWVLVRARPYLTVLAMMLTGLHTVLTVVGRAVGRPLGVLWRWSVAHWRRTWAPVVRTARALRLLLTERFGPRRA